MSSVSVAAAAAASAAEVRVRVKVCQSYVSGSAPGVQLFRTVCSGRGRFDMGGFDRVVYLDSVVISGGSRVEG